MELVNVLENEHLSMLNHSCAHMMAQAVKRLYPNAKFWVGPVISEGFYYDMDLGDVKLKEEDLAKIEKEMKKIAKDGKRIVREEISKKDALEMFKDDPYKIDLINGLEDGNITIYRQGEFADLCRGPHVETVKMCKNFKLLKHSGAYWKGDANNKMLQRVYGICFDTKEELEAHLEALEEAKKRDHKKLGKEMGLFTISEFAPGMPIFLPDGMILRNILEQYWYQEHAKEGYQFIKTPIMMSKELWELSGHWDHYKDNMYTSMVDDREFAIKPMNCPGALLVYNSTLHSYKDLPLRLGELGQVHRHEASGALNGLFRVRTFTQDDAHLFVTPDQLEEEVKKVLQLVDRIYSVFGLPYEIELSTRPESGYIGSEEIWDVSEKALAQACVHAGKEYKVNPGDGAFYGPKLDIHIKDSLGRVWQCGTVQLDMNLPERFECKYVDADGTKKTKIIVVTNKMTDEINEIMKRLSDEQPKMIAGFKDDIVEVLEPFDIYRIFAASGKVFAETNHGEYTLRLRLYEMEQRLDSNFFVRISNSDIINLRKVKGFDLSFAGTICVTLSNGTVTYVSRRFVAKIKQLLGI